MGHADPDERSESSAAGLSDDWNKQFFVTWIFYLWDAFAWIYGRYTAMVSRRSGHLPESGTGHGGAVWFFGISYMSGMRAEDWGVRVLVSVSILEKVRC